MATENIKYSEIFLNGQLAMEKMAKASKSIAEDWDIMLRQLKGHHQTLTDYVLNVARLPPSFRELSKSIITPNEALNRGIEIYERRLKAANFAAKQLKLYIEYADRYGTAADKRYYEAQRKMAMGKAKDDKSAIDYLGSQVALKQQIVKWTGNQLSIEYLITRGFADAVKRSGEMNRMLIEANSNTDERYALNKKVWEVMTLTGHSMQGMLEAGKALTDVGFDQRANFDQVLAVSVQMKDALGVSYENSAQLARVFEINLRTPVREVADQIALIKNNTSLAADEAARFATEVGNALKTLGPGALQGSSAKVAGYVAMMAGRMKDVTGDGAEIVKIFKEMTKGTAQGAMMRGLSGVNNPAAIGSDAGARAAFTGLGRQIDRMLKYPTGSREYTFQLEQIAQIYQTSTETIVLWRKMIEASNKPLDESQKLQKVWEEQMQLGNESWKQIKESLVALMQRGLTPFLGYITPAIAGLAKLVRWMAASDAAWATVWVGIAAGVGTTVVSLGILTRALYRMSGAALAASKTSLIGKAFGLEEFAAFKKGTGPLAKMIQIVSTYLPKLGALVNPIAKIATTFGIAYFIGNLIKDTFPVRWIAMLAERTGDAFEKSWNRSKYQGLVNVTSGVRGGISPTAMAAEVRRMIYTGQGSLIPEYVRASLTHMPGLLTERGIKSQYEESARNALEANQRLVLSSATVMEPETKVISEANTKIAQALLDESKREGSTMQKILVDNAKWRAETAAREERDRAMQKLNQKLTTDESAPLKDNIRWHTPTHRESPM